MRLAIQTIGPCLVLLTTLPCGGSAQAPNEQLIEMSRGLFETQILDQDPSFLLDNSIAEYMVIAPGGVIENRDQVVAGLAAFSAVDSISITNERVHTWEGTGVVLNRLEIHGGPLGPMGQLGPMSAMTVFSLDADGRWWAVSRSLSLCHPRAVERGIC